MTDFNSFRNAVFGWLVGWLVCFGEVFLWGNNLFITFWHYESPIRPVMILMFKYHDESRCELQ